MRTFGLLLQLCEFDNLLCLAGASHIDIQIACAFSQPFFDMQTRFAQETLHWNHKKTTAN